MRLIVSTSGGPKAATTLQKGDLLLQQFALEQHLTQSRLEAVALTRFPIRGLGRQAGLATFEEGVAPTAQRRRCHTE
jgi:hypothetical protein